MIDVAEGWYHPSVKKGQVHDHPAHPGGSWSIATHRLCQQVFTHRPTTASVQRYLDLSASHLPPEAGETDWLEAMDGTIVDDHQGYGWWLWVPSEGLEERIVEHTDPDNPDGLHPAVAAIMRYAAERGCNWVLLDTDGPVNDDLPVLTP